MNAILSAVSTIAFSLSAVPMVVAADVAAPAPYDWGGFYLGVNAGAAWNSADLNSDLVSKVAGRGPLHEFSDDQTAFTGGALVGYNHQIENIVLGLEADINYAGFEETDTTEFVLVSAGRSNDITDEMSFEGNWFGTLRGRIGVAVDNLLLYGTGGAVYGHLSVEENFTGYRPDQTVRLNGDVDDVNWGWTVGGGAEYGLERWSLGLEYLYVDLGSADWETNTWITVNNRDIKAEGTVDWQFSVVLATAKLRF